MKESDRKSSIPRPVGPYRMSIKVHDFLYCSGQIPLVPNTGLVLTGDIQEQAHQVMKNCQAVLEEGGCTWDHVVKATIFLTDLRDFEKVNEVYASYFGSSFPTRSCVQVSALPKGANVEIEVLAHNPD